MKILECAFLILKERKEEALSNHLDEGGRQRPVQRPLVPLRQELPVLLLPRLLLPLAPVPLANLKKEKKKGMNGLAALTGIS